MKFTVDLLLVAFLATSAAAAPLNPIVEMRPRDLDLNAPKPEGYIKRDTDVDATATRSGWKREPDAEVEAIQPEGYIKRDTEVDATATRSGWKRGVEAIEPEGYIKRDTEVDATATRSGWKRNLDAKAEAEAEAAM